MRLLFARVGVPYSPATGLPIESQTVSQMVDRVLALPEGTRSTCSRRSCAAARASTSKELAELMKKGFQRVKVDGEFYEIADARARQEVQARHRRRGRPHRRAPGYRARASPKVLRDRAEARRRPRRRRIRRQAAAASQRTKRQQVETRRTSACCSRKNSPARSPASPFPRSSRGCSPSTIRSAPARPATASAPSRRSTRTSSCPTELSLRDGAIAPWAKTTSPYYTQTLEALAKHYKFKL
jgi:excinuclease ABC subunit A